MALVCYFFHWYFLSSNQGFLKVRRKLIQTCTFRNTFEKTMRVAVTGASGFVGSHIVKLLLQDGHTVHATVRNKDDATKTAHLNKVRDATK